MEIQAVLQVADSGKSFISLTPSSLHTSRPTEIPSLTTIHLSISLVDPSPTDWAGLKQPFYYKELSSSSFSVGSFLRTDLEPAYLNLLKVEQANETQTQWQESLAEAAAKGENKQLWRGEEVFVCGWWQ